LFEIQSIKKRNTIYKCFISDKEENRELFIKTTIFTVV